MEFLVDEEMSITFAGKQFQDIKLFILLIWLLNSVELEQILKARKNKEFISREFTAERFEAGKVGVLAGVTGFAENINTIFGNF